MASFVPTALERIVPRVEVADDAFAQRFRVLLTVLWLHIPMVLVVGEVKGAWSSEPAHSGVMLGMTMPTSGMAASHRVMLYLVLAVSVASAALASMSHRRTVQTYAVTVGLVFGAAALVRAGGGLTDLHFDFFVVLAAVGLLQSAGSFAVAVILVAAHHLVTGIWMPDAVYSDPRVSGNPLPWVLMHTAFVIALCAVQVTYWHFIAAERHALDVLRAAQARIATERLVAEERAVVEIHSAAERAARGRSARPSPHV